MKQTYVKPTIMIERFSLTQNIADFCGIRNPEWGECAQSDKYSCGWRIPSGDIIWLETSGCDDIYGPDDHFGAICYNNPNGGMTIFGS